MLVKDVVAIASNVIKELVFVPIVCQGLRRVVELIVIELFIKIIIKF